MSKRWGPLSAIVDTLTTPKQQDTPDLLTVATWNIGNGSWRNYTADLYGWQEAGDQSAFMRQASKNGVHVYRPDKPAGAASTPVGWRSTIDKPSPFVHPLYKGGPIGPGTGPDIGKPKNLVGLSFTFHGLPIVMGNMHNYAGQRGRNQRALISSNMVREAVGFLNGMDGAKILTLDANTTANGYAVAPLRDAGYSCLQLGITRVPTHGPTWTPDQIWYKPTPFVHIRAIRQYTRNTGSDHKALFNVFEVTGKA